MGRQVAARLVGTVGRQVRAAFTRVVRPPPDVVGRLGPPPFEGTVRVDVHKGPGLVARAARLAGPVALLAPGLPARPETGTPALGTAETAPLTGGRLALGLPVEEEVVLVGAVGETLVVANTSTARPPTANATPPAVVVAGRLVEGLDTVGHVVREVTLEAAPVARRLA